MPMIQLRNRVGEVIKGPRDIADFFYSAMGHKNEHPEICPLLATIELDDDTRFTSLQAHQLAKEVESLLGVSTLGAEDAEPMLQYCRECTFGRYLEILGR